MRWSFVNGILLGGLAGSLLGLYYCPRMKPNPQKFLLGQTRRIGRKTGRMMTDMAREVQGLIRR